MQARKFARSAYTPRSFARAMLEMMRHIPDTHAAVHGGRVSKTFAEKIMLAVTQVNNCRYCNYHHTRQALKAGVSEEEIKRLAKVELGDFPEEEAVALMFAQHYAESGGQPEPAAWARLVDYYGEQTARDILAYIRMIMMGNLLGNTFEAIVYRLTGRLAPAD